MRRPLLRVALVYVAGVLAGEWVSFSPFVLLMAALGVAVLALVWARARVGLMSALIFLTAWTNLTLHTAVLSPNDLRAILQDQANIVTLRGTVCETPSFRVYDQGEKETWRTMARVEVTALCPNRKEWRPASGLIAVTTPGMLTNFYAGQTVEITGVIALPRIAVAEGTFDYRAYLKELGIYHELKTESEQDWQIISSPNARPLADRFRDWARQALKRGLPLEDESLRLEWALTLGWKTALTEEVSEPFVQAATYHIFAVDGLRMAIIFGIFFGLFRAMRIPRAVCGLILVPLIWFYVALTGWPASAIRATVMLTVVIGGWALNRPSDLLNSLFAAALLILLWEPQQLFQAGFQLSFLVVLCIILTVPPVYEWLRRVTAPDPLLPAPLHPRWRQTLAGPGRWLGGLAATSFAAWIGSLPLVAYYFNIITPVSTPANVLAVPLCALVLVSNLASLLLTCWIPAAAELFNHAGWFLMECIRVSSLWFAHWPIAYHYVPAPSLFTSGLYYFVLLAFVTGWIFRPKLRLCKFTVLGLLITIWCWQCWHECSVTRLSILPANGALAIYFDAPGSKSDLLIDCGSSNSVAFVTKPFLRAQGVNALPRLLLTHGDLHHIGGAEMAAELFAVRQVCVSPVRFRSAVYRRTLAEFNLRPGLVRNLSRNDQLGPWTVLHPLANDRFSAADDGALVLSGTFHGARILLLSDLGRAGQDALLERTPDLRADIVMAGLPSVGEPLCNALLDAIQPRLIIVADSEFPVSERASEKLRARLAERRIPVICTRSAGSATLEFRAHGWEARFMDGTRLTSRELVPPDR